MVGPNSLNNQNLNLKFLCSYGGKILPRHPDGMLRYHGGITRVLAVNRSISFSELLVKLGELCGSSVSLRCQLPTDDLDALVSIKSDEDLANLVEEYDRAAVTTSSSMKIRAFLSLAKNISPPTSTTSTSPKSPLPPPRTRKHCNSTRFPTPVDVVEVNRWCIRRPPNRTPAAGLVPVLYGNKYAARKFGCYANENSARIFLIYNAHHWQ